MEKVRQTEGQPLFVTTRRRLDTWNTIRTRYPHTLTIRDRFRDRTCTIQTNAVQITHLLFNAYWD